MITIRPGLKRGHYQPYTITIDSSIYFITYDENSDSVEYNCFVEDDEIKNFLKEILYHHLTNGKNVLY